MRRKAKGTTTWCPVHGSSQGTECRGCRDRSADFAHRMKRKQRELDSAEAAIKQIFADTDFEALKQILEPVVPIEHAKDGLLCLRFQDGTRLSFLCGPSGRLNVVTVQHGPDTPELRLPKE